MKTPPSSSKLLRGLFGCILALSLTACGSGGGAGTSVAGAELLTDLGASPSASTGTTTGATTGAATGTSSAVGSTGALSGAVAATPVLPGTLLPGQTPSSGGGSSTGGTAGGATGGAGSSGGSGTSTGPVVLSSNPSQGAINVALSSVGSDNAVSATPVSATFSETMAPASLATPATAFTLMESVSGRQVAGLVSLSVNNSVATFVPTSALLANTAYIASVTSSATNTAGTPLQAHYAWMFTTGASGSVGQAPIDLGAAAAFVALGGTAIENVSTADNPTRVNGQLGVYQNSPTVVKGFTASSPVGTGLILSGGIQTIPAMLTVESDFRKAALEASNRTLNQTRIGIADLALTQVGGGTPGVFPPGLYASGSATLMLKAGNLTLDAQGNPDAVWVFQADSSFIVGDGRQIILANGARANQVFWVVGSSVTVGDLVAFKGNILAGSSVTLGTSALRGTALEGRAMSASSLNLNRATLDKPGL